MKILTILNPGFEELEATGTIIVLKRAGYQVDIAWETDEVNGKHIFNYQKLLNLNSVNYADYDLLFLPGGGYTPSSKTNEAILYFHKHNKYLAAICSGPTYFGKLGLLKGLNYTCFPALNADFGGNFQNEYVVYDQKIFTARSVAASILLPLKIVEILDGTEKLKQLKMSMEYLPSDL